MTTPRIRLSDDGAIVPDGDRQDWIAGMRMATGTTDQHLTDLLVKQTANVVGAADDQPASIIDLTNAALVQLFGINPNTPIEGMLAAQMVACHNLAMQLVSRANWNESTELRALYAGLAAKLMRAFTGQIDALARLRGKQATKQVVRVEHVHVEAGGRAVVGAVAGRGRG